jgi:archaellin
MISEELYDKVYYYRNVIEDPKKIVDLIESTQDDKFSSFITKWEEWSACSGQMYIYGEHKRIKCLNMDEVIKDCPEEILDEAKYLFSEIFDGMRKVCEDYAQKVNDDSKIILMTDTAIKKYMTGTFMGSHFDQQEGDRRLRYSLVMYLNDDYEGGELSFNVKDGVLTSTDDAANEDFNNPMNEGKVMFHVKPEAGSVIIFPSTDPYSHTAHLIKSGSKYMVPSFWLNKGKFVDGVFIPE